MSVNTNCWMLVATCAFASCSSNAARSDATITDAAAIDAAGPGPCNGSPGLKITFVNAQSAGLSGDSQALLTVMYANNTTQDLTTELPFPSLVSLEEIMVISAYSATASSGLATATFHKYDEPSFSGSVTVSVDLQSCTDFPIPLHDDLAIDAPLASDASGPVDAGAALTWYFTCPDGICTAPLDAGLTDDGGSPCPAVGTTCATRGQGCGTSNPGVHCGATEVCDDHDPTTDGHGCPI